MNKPKPKKIVFAVNSHGLGHATRCTPLIEACLKKKCQVFIISDGRALDFLKIQFKSKIKKYFQLPDYSFNKVYSSKRFHAKRFFFLTPFFLQEIKKERLAFEKLDKKYDFDIIISDTRYGIYNKHKPSYLLMHLIKVPVPPFTWFSYLWCDLYFKTVKQGKFTKILIPDYKDNPLAGELTHNFRFLRPGDYEYIGHLSMLKKLNIKEDIDYFFSISGPEPQRSLFEKNVMEICRSLSDKNIVITLGRPEQKKITKKRNLTIYGFLNSQQQNEIFNRAKMIITRPGYSTVMDLAELGKKAFFIPTTKQPEHEYLAHYHRRKKNVNFDNLKNFQAEDIINNKTYQGINNKLKNLNTINNFLNILTEENNV